MSLVSLTDSFFRNILRDAKHKRKMAEQTITNRMLYDLILDFKKDVDERFERVESAVEKNRHSIEGNREAIFKLEKRINRAESRLDRITVRLDKMSEQLYDIQMHRDKVAVKFTRSWAGASFFIALLASTIVLAFDKAF